MTGLRSPSNQCRIKFDPINPAPPVTRIGLSIRTEALSCRYLRPVVAYARRQDLQKLDCNGKGLRALDGWINGGHVNELGFALNATIRLVFPLPLARALDPVLSSEAA